MLKLSRPEDLELESENKIQIGWPIGMKFSLWNEQQRGNIGAYTSYLYKLEDVSCFPIKR